MKTFAGDKMMFIMFVFIWVSEGDLREWSTPAWVMNDLPNNPLNISFSFREIKSSECCRSKSMEFMGSENTSRLSLSLVYVKLCQE